MKGNVVEIQGTIVLVRGVARGMAREAPCELLARKRLLPGLDSHGRKRYEYTQCSVLQAPSDLPDGEYVVTTEDGHSIATAKMYGHWLLATAESTPADRKERA